MDIVTDAGAVVGIVVIAVDTQVLPAADGHLGDIGHQVVGHTTGIFADVTAFMGADGIEVAQQHDSPFLIRKSHAGEDLLSHILGPAVRVGAAAGTGGLPQGHFIVGSIHGGGGGENDILHAHLFHDLGQHQGGIQVVIIILPRDGHGFAHGLQAREMNDAADLIFRENFAQQRFITDITFVKFQTLSGELLHTVQALRVGIAQIVNDHHAVTAFQQFHAGMAADITGAAGNQNIHEQNPPLMLIFCVYISSVCKKKQVVLFLTLVFVLIFSFRNDIINDG